MGKKNKVFLVIDGKKYISEDLVRALLLKAIDELCDKEKNNTKRGTEQE